MSEHDVVLIGEDEPDNQVILQTVVETLVLHGDTGLSRECLE